MPSRPPPIGKTKITINVYPQIKQRWKELAAHYGVYVQDMIIEGVDLWLDQKRQQEEMKATD